MQSWSPSGLPHVPHLEWGSHLAHVFAGGSELRDVLVPFFKAGLDNNERCLWVTGKAFNADDARSALRAAVPDLDRRERNKQIEIADSDAWYVSGTMPRPRELVDKLLDRGDDALSAGHTGLRTSGNCAWVTSDQWSDFQEYERLVQTSTRGRRMICLCSYCEDQFAYGSHRDVMARHDLIVPTRCDSVAAVPDARPRKAESEPSSPLLAAMAGIDQRILDALPIGFYASAATHLRSCNGRVADGHMALHI